MKRNTDCAGAKKARRQATPCRHRRAWIFAYQMQSYPNFLLVWCYECGAIREQKNVTASETILSRWAKPVGHDGENPWKRFEFGRKQYLSPSVKNTRALKRKKK